MSAAIVNNFDDKVTFNDRVETVKEFTLRVLKTVVAQTESKEVSARSTVVNTVTVQPDPWDEIFGRYDNDPSWEDFPRWLREHRRSINSPD